MFKFESRRATTTPISGLAPPNLPTQEMAHRALLAWGEHCVECAAPACFSTCDLFDPTPDGKCRRFDDGLVLTRPASGGAAAAQVKFRRWGKLEAQGNAKLMPNRQVALMETALGHAWRPAFSFGKMLARLSGDVRFSTMIEAFHKRLNDWLRTHNEGGAAPDHFIADITNPADVEVELTLSIAIDRARLARAIPADQLPPPLLASILATPGFSHHEIPINGIRDIIASKLPFNLAIIPAGDTTPHLVFHTLEMVALAKVASAQVVATTEDAAHPMAKCVVFDLDNTLWEGVLLEGEVRLRPGVEDLFRILDERGILLSIVSKNAPDDALAQLRIFGLEQYLLYPRIGWGPKSQGLSDLARAIDIGIDTLIFIDDNPFERAEVAEAVPEVAVLPETALATLVEHPRLQGAVTPESRQRRKFYQEAIAREETAAAYGDDYQAFLRTCAIHVDIRPDTPEDFERVVELVQRTNQLNFSGRKYKREEISALLNDPDQSRHVIAVRDKFGSYGTVGFALSHREGEVVCVDDFMLSCRVQGKFVEQALFWYLAELSGEPVAEAIQVNFHRTNRNRAAEMVIEKLGFAAIEDRGLVRSVTPGDLAVDFLTVNG